MTSQRHESKLLCEVAFVSSLRSSSAPMGFLLPSFNPIPSRQRVSDVKATPASFHPRPASGGNELTITPNSVYIDRDLPSCTVCDSWVYFRSFPLASSCARKMLNHTSFHFDTASCQFMSRLESFLNFKYTMGAEEKF